MTCQAAPFRSRRPPPPPPVPELILRSPSSLLFHPHFLHLSIFLARLTLSPPIFFHLLLHSITLHPIILLHHLYQTTHNLHRQHPSRSPPAMAGSSSSNFHNQIVQTIQQEKFIFLQSTPHLSESDRERMWNQRKTQIVSQIKYDLDSPLVPRSMSRQRSESTQQIPVCPSNLCFLFVLTRLLLIFCRPSISRSAWTDPPQINLFNPLLLRRTSLAHQATSPS